MSCITGVLVQIDDGQAGEGRRTAADLDAGLGLRRDRSGERSAGGRRKRPPTWSSMRSAASSAALPGAWWCRRPGNLALDQGSGHRQHGRQPAGRALKREAWAWGSERWAASATGWRSTASRPRGAALRLEFWAASLPNSRRAPQIGAVCLRPKRAKWPAGTPGPWRRDGADCSFASGRRPRTRSGRRSRSPRSGAKSWQSIRRRRPLSFFSSPTWHWPARVGAPRRLRGSALCRHRGSLQAWEISLPESSP